MTHYDSLKIDDSELLHDINDEYDICQLEHIFNTLLGKETPKLETLEEQLIHYNLHDEYNTLTPIFDKLDNYEKAKYLIFRGIIKMSNFDPLNGNKPDIMSDSDKEYWDDLESDIKNGGLLLYNQKDHSNTNGLSDDLIWSFIPKSLKHKIHMLFDELDI